MDSDILRTETRVVTSDALDSQKPVFHLYADTKGSGNLPIIDANLPRQGKG